MHAGSTCILQSLLQAESLQGGSPSWGHTAHRRWSWVWVFQFTTRHQYMKSMHIESICAFMMLCTYVVNINFIHKLCGDNWSNVSWNWGNSRLSNFGSLQCFHFQICYAQRSIWWLLWTVAGLGWDRRWYFACLHVLLPRSLPTDQELEAEYVCYILYTCVYMWMC